MKSKLLFALSVSSIIFFAACSDGPPKQKSSTEVAKEQNEQKMDGTGMEKEADFLVKVADGNMLEVELGKIAERNGSMQDVKNFGKMMVEHHTKILDELKTLAISKNITIPDGMSDEHHKKVDKLSGKAGHDFDEEYIEAMVKDHKKDVKEFEDKSTDEKYDADIRNWVTATLPTLRNHLAEINKVDEKFEAMKK